MKTTNKCCHLVW